MITQKEFNELCRREDRLLKWLTPLQLLCKVCEKMNDKAYLELINEIFEEERKKHN